MEYKAEGFKMNMVAMNMIKGRAELVIDWIRVDGYLIRNMSSLFNGSRACVRLGSRGIF